jgi:hypothetical protein
VPRRSLEPREQRARISCTDVLELVPEQQFSRRAVRCERPRRNDDPWMEKPDDRGADIRGEKHNTHLDIGTNSRMHDSQFARATRVDRHNCRRNHACDPDEAARSAKIRRDPIERRCGSADKSGDQH